MQDLALHSHGESCCQHISVNCDGLGLCWLADQRISTSISHAGLHLRRPCGHLARLPFQRPVVRQCR